MRRFAIVTLLVAVAAACGRSPSSPSQPAAASPSPAAVTFADFSGLWTATYRITACEWERHCVFYIGTEREFNLRLVQSGSHVRGLFVDGTAAAAADVEGDVSSDGTLVMTGQSGPASSRDGSFQVSEIRIRRGAGPELQGQVSYENRLAPQDLEIGLGTKISGAIVSAAKSDLSMFAAAIDGTYHGRFVVRSCTPISLYCYPNQVEEVADLFLTVTRDASGVSATFQRSGTRVPLRGTLSDRTLLLAGETTTGITGFESLDRVTNWRGTIDAFGRISGTFHFDMVYPIAKPSLGGSADCELVQLVKSVS